MTNDQNHEYLHPRLHERYFHNRCFQLFAARHNVDFCTQFGVFHLHITHTDRFVERRRVGAGGNDTDRGSALALDHVVVARHPALTVQHEAHKFAFHAFRFLLHEAVFGGEISGLAQFGDPAKTRFEGAGGVVDVVAVEAVAHFEAERVACAESGRLDAVLLPSLEHLVPDFGDILVFGVNLEAARAGVSCSSPRNGLA